MLHSKSRHEKSKLWDKLKLLNKIDNSYWRAIVNSNENSSGKIKIIDKILDEFKIKDGVKQGGVLSPFLFNLYINNLLDECLRAYIGAKMGSFNVSIICYCNDISIISSSISEMNKLLELCGEYAKKW